MDLPRAQSKEELVQIDLGRFAFRRNGEHRLATHSMRTSEAQKLASYEMSIEVALRLFIVRRSGGHRLAAQANDISEAQKLRKRGARRKLIHLEGIRSRGRVLQSLA